MNYIVFTQDIPGERAWLQEKLPTCQNFETHSSGKWPATQPIITDFDSIWEVPIECKDDISHWSGTKIISLFDPDHRAFRDRWSDSDSVLFDPHDFRRAPRSKKALVLHLARSGTKFLESVLDDYCLYDRIVDRGRPRRINYVSRTELVGTSHHVPHNPYYVTQGGENYGEIDYGIIENQRPDIFFVYRKNWWEWAVSNLIVNQIGAYHYDTVPDLSDFEPATIHQDDIIHLVDVVKYAFNNLVEMRCRFRDLNFYIFEHSDLIKNQQLTKHSKINYNKKTFFTNYDDAKQWFDDRYREKFNACAERCISHLRKLGCETPVDFSDIYSANKGV